ncbi:MAG: hypothetical protein ABI867_22095 [Kofleriaceae bacterium]
MRDVECSRCESRSGPPPSRAPSLFLADVVRVIVARARSCSISIRCTSEAIDSIRGGFYELETTFGAMLRRASSENAASSCWSSEVIRLHNPWSSIDSLDAPIRSADEKLIRRVTTHASCDGRLEVMTRQPIASANYRVGIADHNISMTDTAPCHSNSQRH